MRDYSANRYFLSSVVTMRARKGRVRAQVGAAAGGDCGFALKYRSPGGIVVELRCPQAVDKSSVHSSDGADR